MSKIFEDEFMDMQSSIISLCMELTKGAVDRIYVYVSFEDGYEFNAFFEKQGKILGLRELNVDKAAKARISTFFDCGIEDMQKLEEVCKKYEKPVPMGMKMIYDVKTHRFDAEYEYEPVQTMDRGFVDIFEEWQEEVMIALRRMQNQVKTSTDPKKPRFRFPFFGKH